MFKRFNKHKHTTAGFAKGASRKLEAVALATALTLTLASPGVRAEASAKNGKGTFAYLDVGQGNAELIKIGNRATLIDTGRKWEYDELQAQLKTCGVSTINTLVLSHPDADHIENADRIIADYKVKTVVMPKIKAKTQCYKKAIAAIKQHKVKKVNPKIGSKITLGEKCTGEVLSVDANPRDANESSIVLRVTYGKRAFLYTGDATAKVENDILTAKKPVASDVYLASHHGANTANGALFVKKALSAKYKIAVVSVGKNNYGHPTKEVMGRLEKYSKNLFRTDEDGMIVFRTDGSGLAKVAK